MSELNPGDLAILTQTVNGLLPGDFVQRGTVLIAKTRSRKTGFWLCESLSASYWISDQFLTKYTEGGPPQMFVSVSMPHGKLPSEQVSVDRRQYEALCTIASNAIALIWEGCYYGTDEMQRDLYEGGLIQKSFEFHDYYIPAGAWYKKPKWYEESVQNFF